MTQKDASSESDSVGIDAPSVIAYLQAHPEFFREHPELLAQLALPIKETGSRKVLDFQSYAVSALQENVQSLRDQFSGLLNCARDNMSAQAQVHQAVLQLMRARDLEALLHSLTQDFMQAFDVDAVRLVLESELADLYESTYGELNYSGVSFVPVGTVSYALGGDAKKAALVPDTHIDPPYGFSAIFIDCAAMIRSCALLRIYLPRIDREGILAFGVRDPEHFQPTLGVELLQFLAHAVAIRLDQCLNEQEIEALR
jgi:uncharacterized protein